MKRVLIVFGTRPEAIKMAPLIRAFLKENVHFSLKVCVTAQHREMLDQVLSFFEIVPEYDLNFMKPNQSLYSLTSDIILGMKSVFEDFKPDYVFVHGDTTTSMVTSLAAYYYRCKVAHVEAGLRTQNKWAPFPEEINRQITGRIADLHFAPTINAKNNLIKENISKNQILVTGNTVIDALLYSVEKVYSNTYTNNEIELLQSTLKQNEDIILVTGHRRENFGQGFINICHALKRIAETRPDIQIVYPVHLNPNVQDPVYTILGKIKNLFLISPLSYPSLVWLMKKSKLVITDSGGIQEEAPSLGKPVLVMRETTERPEAVSAGTVILVGTDYDRIVNETLDLLDNNDRYLKMSRVYNPYGDGDACGKIINFLKKC